MTLRKLTSTDAFVVSDIPDAPAAGVVRLARKILQGGAKDLARTASYTFASFQMEVGGASAGINAEGDSIGDALGNFVEELLPSVESGDLHLSPAKGVSAEALAPLDAVAERNELAGSPGIAAAGVVEATSWALGGLDGRRVAIEGSGVVPNLVAEELQAAGATIVEVEGVETKPWMIWGADADAILAGSKAGTLTHQGTPFVKAKAIVPWGPIPVSTKAFASLQREGVAVLPDFISAAGGLMAGYVEGDKEKVTATVTNGIRALLEEVGDHEEGVLLASCYRAESFLATWTDTRLFGRPLAA